MIILKYVLQMYGIKLNTRVIMLIIGTRERIFISNKAKICNDYSHDCYRISQKLA